MPKALNKNFCHLTHSHLKNRGAILEGSSRSGKTFSGIDFIIYLCSHYEGLTINIIKETYNSFKTTLYDDFARRLDGLNVNNPFKNLKEIKSYILFDNKINFLGADDESKFHGAGCDFAWFNEMLDIPKAIFDHTEMRCRQFWWGDYNPKCTDHYVFDLLKRDDVSFLHSTIVDNPFISEGEKKKILSYEPTEENIRRGTADDYMWKVYGLGLRASPHGLVFNNIEWIDSFPTDIEQIYFGLDFGYTNSPSALARVGVNGNNLFCECCFYAPTENADILYPAIYDIIGSKYVCADSADPAMISDLRRRGMNVLAVNKFHNSIQYGIDIMKRYKIHVVRNLNAKKEFENYKWRELGGVILNEPVKEHDHFIDAIRYACITNLRF